MANGSAPPMPAAKTIKPDCEPAVEPRSRRGLRVAAILAALAMPLATLFIAAPATPQTLSCAAAAIPAEFAICNSEKLQLLNQRVDAAFRNLAAGPDIAAQDRRILKRQAEWLSERDACAADFDCLEARYRQRLEELDGSPSRHRVPITTFKRFADTAAKR